jgi:hypothetical protein
VVAVSDGEWQITYTLSVASEIWSMTIEVQPNGDGPYHEIAGSSFAIICQVTDADASNTVISGDGATDAIAGDPTNFTVTLHDSGNNQRTSGGDQLAVTIVPDSGLATAEGIEVFDQLDGTYIIEYEIFDTSSTYTISVTTNQDSSNIKTSTLTVVSNLTSPSVSEFSSTDLSWPTTAASTTINLEEDYSFLTDLKDAYANPIFERAQSLLTEIEGVGQKVYYTAVVTDISIGRYETTFTVPTSGERNVSLCGAYSLHQYLVEAGGLRASYYANKWFSPYGEPYLTQIDEVINQNWGNETDIIPGIAREYVSIEWEGYLMPAETGDHYF